MQAINRIHHISAIVGDAQENLNFYRDVMGLKLIKQTVNFDDPSVYHLYFANQKVENGTVMTFFPWGNAYAGKKGSGQVGRIAFAIPKGSMAEWQAYLTQETIATTKTLRFGKETLEFHDRHQLDLALVEVEEERDSKDIIGFFGAELFSSQPLQTGILLSKEMGMKQLQDTETHYVFETAGVEAHRIILPKEALPMGSWGVGTVHHIAWSVPDDATQIAWQEYLMDREYGVTEVKDRNYFKAIYTKERGNIIFEFATDGPGFTADEDFETLGSLLKLPPQYEPMRERIESRLKPLV